METIARYRNARHSGLSPMLAIAEARTSAYAMCVMMRGFPLSTATGAISRQPKAPSEAFCEDMAGHFRFVNFADLIATRMDHKGWYIHDDGGSGEVYRGAVWRLPARKGREQFIAGYVDPYNDNAAYIDLGTIHETEVEAAYAADQIAEYQASEARDYDRAWQAGRRVESIAEEISDERQTVFALGRDRRKMRAAAPDAPAICDLIRGSIQDAIARIQTLRDERADLILNYGDEVGFAE